MAEPLWHVSINGKQRGPFPLDRLKKTAEAGGLPEDALVRRDGWENWRPWREVPILFPQPAAPAAWAPQQPPTVAGRLPDSASAVVAADQSEARRPPIAPLALPGGDRSTASENKLLAYLTFRRMVTPTAILVVYWIGVAAIALYGSIWLVTSGLAAVQGGADGGLLGVVMFLTGLLMLPVAIVMWRVYCEVIAVLFRIYETLTEISAKLERANP